MTETPKDVLKMAREAAAKAAEKYSWFMAQAMREGRADSHGFVQSAILAILAERERVQSLAAATTSPRDGDWVELKNVGCSGFIWSESRPRSPAPVIPEDRMERAKRCYIAYQTTGRAGSGAASIVAWEWDQFQPAVQELWARVGDAALPPAPAHGEAGDE